MFHRFVETHHYGNRGPSTVSFPRLNQDQEEPSRMTSRAAGSSTIYAPQYQPPAADYSRNI